MMLAEVARMLKLHPQFIHGLCPCNNQNVEQPERKVFTLPHTCAHTHTHTHTHTDRMVVQSPAAFRGKFQHAMNCRVTAEFG